MINKSIVDTNGGKADRRTDKYTDKPFKKSRLI